MNKVVFSVVLAVLASGCAMGGEGPEDCSGSCNEASVELSKTEAAKLAGVWISADGTRSMELSENGYCQLDHVPCTFTVRATAPEGAHPWHFDITPQYGQKLTFEIELVAADALVAKQGDTFVDFIKNGGSPLPTKSATFQKEDPSQATFDAIQPYGRVAGQKH